jgi:hypothetical protein
MVPALVIPHHRYAQTNLQLYGQLLERGANEAELALVRAAYEVATRHFSNRFRAGGKPFLAHLVGTASIAAAHGAPNDAVAAGLVHAIYAGGATKRASVRRALGSDVEALVFGYSRVRWRTPMLAEVTPPASDGAERSIMVLRLANDLDDLLDLAPAYSAKFDEKRLRTRVGELGRIATCMGLDDLADEIRAAHRDLSAAIVPEVLRSSAGGAYRVKPVASGLWRGRTVRGALRRVATIARR